MAKILVLGCTGGGGGGGSSENSCFHSIESKDTDLD